MQVFTPHVERWIHNSQDALCQRCHQLEGSTQALQGGATGEDGEPVAKLVLVHVSLGFRCSPDAWELQAASQSLTNC